MDEDLLREINEIYFERYKRITGVRWQNGVPWDLSIFDDDVEYGGRGQSVRCVIVVKRIYDPDDLQMVDDVEYLLAEAWPL